MSGNIVFIHFPRSRWLDSEIRLASAADEGDGEQVGRSPAQPRERRGAVLFWTRTKCHI